MGWIARGGAGWATVGTLPNPEAHGDSKITLSSGPALRLFPLEKLRTDEATSSSKTKRIGKNAWATGREIFRRSTQISHARRAGKPSLLNDWAMLSVGVIIDEGEIKGVAAVAAG